MYYFINIKLQIHHHQHQHQSLCKISNSFLRPHNFEYSKASIVNCIS